MWLLCKEVVCAVGCINVLGSLFFFKQKTAYEMRIRDWSSDVCSSDLMGGRSQGSGRPGNQAAEENIDRGLGAEIQSSAGVSPAWSAICCRIEGVISSIASGCSGMLPKPQFWRGFLPR